MDLDEMKLAWSDMSVQLEQQKKLTDEVIFKMTQEKSSSRLGRIIMAETSGVFISIAALFYVLANFYKFDNWLEITGGIGTLAILLLGIVFGLRIISQANRIDLTKHDLKTTLSLFKAFKSSLGFYKRLSIITNIIGPLFVFPAAFALFTDKDLLENPSAAITGLIAAMVIVPVVLYFIIKFYKKNIGAVSTAFKDLEK